MLADYLNIIFYLTWQIGTESKIFYKIFVLNDDKNTGEKLLEEQLDKCTFECGF